ncbi:MAG: FAD:protein FMN transferase [Oscillospiraceae bacterium]|nr:FAD:protein FMN transferase [Oscillospiraceae bacterium]
MKRIFLILITVSLLLCGCGKEQEPAQMTVFCMDTVMDLRVWGKDQDAAVGRLYAKLQELEGTWSATDEDSVLSNLNRGNVLLKLDPSQDALLYRVEQLSRRTGGAFHPKMGALMDAWGFYDDSFRVPEAAQIADALEAGKWDLGAAMKGYAGQACANLLEELEIDRAMLSLGGNVQTYGEKPDGQPWQVAIQNPNFADDYIGVVAVSGTASVVTSGDYQRFFEIDGKTYHHIMDPKTGYPAESGLSSVTIICRDGLTADCLSTALFVMGLEKSMEFWRESDDFEAVFITCGGEIYATEGANLSGCEYEVITR